MEETSEARREYVFHDGFFSVGPIMLKFSRITSTFVIAGAAVMIWLRSGWEINGLFSKFFSAFLFLDVLFSPSLISWREKKTGKKVECSAFAEMGYRWLLYIAMLTFLSH